MNIRMCVDGGKKPVCVYGSFAVFVNLEQDSRRREYYEYEASEASTSNEAEYLTLIKGLEYLRDLAGRWEGARESEILILMDSNLVVNQMNGKFRVKATNLRDYYKEALSLMNEVKRLYKQVRLTWVDRKVIKHALGH